MEFKEEDSWCADFSPALPQTGLKSYLPFSFQCASELCTTWISYNRYPELVGSYRSLSSLTILQGLWVKNSGSLSLSFWPYRNRKATSQICCPVEGEIYSTRFHSRYLKDYGQWGFKDGEMSLLPWYEFS